MSATGNIYRLIMHTVLQGQECLNMFGYISQTGLPHASNLAIAFDTLVTPDWRAIVCDALTFTEVEVFNIDDPSDFYSQGLSAGGSVSGAYLPRFNAWAFELNRPTTLIRNGAKRLAGVPVASQLDGEAVAGVLTALNLVATDMATTLSGSGGETYAPAILHHQPLLVPPYAAYHFISASYKRISTQNSRKT